MHAIITAATANEWKPSFLHCEQFYPHKKNKIKFHETGVGLLASAVNLTELALKEKPSLLIQAGIAGAFDNHVALGELMIVKDESVADMGVMENKIWKDLFDLKLQKKNAHPYINKKLTNPWLKKLNFLNLPEVAGVTVNRISTDKNEINRNEKKLHAKVETMEGAALHYVALKYEIPFIQIRAISNYTGERNKKNWQIKTAIQNLNDILILYINEILNKKLV